MALVTGSLTTASNLTEGFIAYTRLGADRVTQYEGVFSIVI